MQNNGDKHYSRVPLDDEFLINTDFKLELPNPWPEAKSVFIISESAKLDVPLFTIFNMRAEPIIYIPPTMNIDFEELLIKDQDFPVPDEPLDTDEELFLNDSLEKDKETPKPLPGEQKSQSHYPVDEGSERQNHNVSILSWEKENSQGVHLSDQPVDKGMLQKKLAKIIEEKISTSFAEGDALRCEDLFHPTRNCKAKRLLPLKIYAPSKAQGDDLVLLKLFRKIAAQKSQIKKFCRLGVKETLEKSLNVYKIKRSDETRAVLEKEKEFVVLENREKHQPILLFEDAEGACYRFLVISRQYLVRKEVPFSDRAMLEIVYKQTDKGSSGIQNNSDNAGSESFDEGDAADSLDNLIPE